MRKNWKILLPVCTVAATATALAPCLTSCSNNGKWTDLSDWHPDESTRHAKKDDMTNLQAANALFGASNSIKEQDILFAHKTKIEDPSAEWRSILESELLITAGDVEVEKCSVQGLKFEHKDTEPTAAFSGTIKIDFKCIMTAQTTDPDPETINIGTYTVEIKHEINKLPIEMKSESNKWSIERGDLTDKEWTVDRSYSAVKSFYDPSLTDQKESNSFTYNHKFLPDPDDSIETFLFDMVFWGPSYYLSDCTPPTA